VCILTSSRDEFWSDTFSALREHEYEIDKQIHGALYVEKRAWRQQIAPTTQTPAELQAFWREFTEAVTQALAIDPSGATPTDGTTTPTEVV
jgi:hypothetical protein